MQLSKIALFMFSLCPLPAIGEVVTGNALFEACENTNVSAAQGFCLGYIVGSMEGLRYGTSLPFVAAGNLADNSELNTTVEVFLGMCPASEVEYGQHRDLVVKYLKANPEIRHQSARALILEAGQKAFPCP